MANQKSRKGSSKKGSSAVGLPPRLSVLFEERHQLTLVCHSIARNDTEGKFNGTFDSAPFLEFHFKPFLAIPLYLRRTDADLHDCVNLWCKDRLAAELEYGHIEDWITSAVTSMMGLFTQKRKFNDDISGWDTLSVISMSGMFDGASSFDQALDGWNTGSVTDMSGMFAGASSFNQSLDGWNTGSVTDMSG